MLSLLYHMGWQSVVRQALERVPEAEPVIVGEERCNTYAGGANAQNLLAVFDYCLDLLDCVFQSEPMVELRALDLACGSGQLLALMAERYPGVRLTGVDASADMLNLARERLLSRADARQFSLMEGNVLHLSGIPDHYYHATTWTMAAHHTQNLMEVSQVVGEMARVTHPDGAILVLDLGRLKTKALNEWYIHWAGRSFDPALLQEFAMSMNAAYSAAEFMALIEALNIPGLHHYAAFGLPVLQLLYRPPRGSLLRDPARKRTMPPARDAAIVRDYRQLQSLFKLSGLVVL